MAKFQLEILEILRKLGFKVINEFFLGFQIFNGILAIDDISVDIRYIICNELTNLHY